MRLVFAALFSWLMFLATAAAGIWIAVSPTPTAIHFAAFLLFTAALYWLLTAVAATLGREGFLNWIEVGFESPETHASVPLSLVPKEAFFRNVGGRVEGTLGRVADLLNAAPQEGIVRESEDLVWLCLREIQERVITLGRRYRWGGGVTACSPIFSRKPLFAGHALWTRLVDRTRRGIADASDALKNAILDMGETEPRWVPEPVLILPSLSRERFIEEMHVSFEAALHGVLRAINDNESEEAAAGEIHSLFAALHRDLLEAGLDMRLTAWAETLPASVKTAAEIAAQFPLRKAADPPLPRAQLNRLRWADKYRRMRAAGTSLPLATAPRVV